VSAVALRPPCIFIVYARYIANSRQRRKCGDGSPQYYLRDNFTSKENTELTEESKNTIRFVSSLSAGANRGTKKGSRW